MNVIRSKDNARVKAWARLRDEPGERRRTGLALIEGVHLVETYLGLGHLPTGLIIGESAMARPDIRQLAQRSSVAVVVLSDAAFRRVSGTEAPAGIAAEIALPHSSIDPAVSPGCLFLDGIQDAGNVGTLLRSAASFGIPDVILGPGCADPWSAKALRAGMGGQFYLQVAHSIDLPGDIRRFGGQSICTVARGGMPVSSIDLTGRIGWIFGGEGAGVSRDVAARATRKATIVMPGGTESLNVAASAAICLYEQHRQVSRRDVLS